MSFRLGGLEKAGAQLQFPPAWCLCVCVAVYGWMPPSFSKGLQIGDRAARILSLFGMRMNGGRKTLMWKDGRYQGDLLLTTYQQGREVFLKCCGLKSKKVLEWVSVLQHQHTHCFFETTPLESKPTIKDALRDVFKEIGDWVYLHQSTSSHGM